MRYPLLLLLNSPIIAIALLNAVTKYKLGQLDKTKFTKQLISWLGLLAVLLVALPIYNYSHNDSLFQSDKLSILDIVQTTAIVYLVFIVNTLRLKVEKSEQRLRDLHQELSIRLSDK